MKYTKSSKYMRDAEDFAKDIGYPSLEIWLEDTKDMIIETMDTNFDVHIEEAVLDIVERHKEEYKSTCVLRYGDELWREKYKNYFTPYSIRENSELIDGCYHMTEKDFFALNKALALNNLGLSYYGFDYWRRAGINFVDTQDNCLIRMLLLSSKKYKEEDLRDIH